MTVFIAMATVFVSMKSMFVPNEHGLHRDEDGRHGDEDGPLFASPFASTGYSYFTVQVTLSFTGFFF